MKPPRRWPRSTCRRRRRTRTEGDMETTADPLDKLHACHGRIEEQLQTLETMARQRSAGMPDSAAEFAAKAVLRYFDTAGAQHQRDEDVDVFPLLRARAAALGRIEVAAAIDELEREHATVEAQWRRLREALSAVATLTGRRRHRCRRSRALRLAVPPPHGPRGAARAALRARGVETGGACRARRADGGAPRREVASPHGDRPRLRDDGRPRDGSRARRLPGQDLPLLLASTACRPSRPTRQKFLAGKTKPEARAGRALNTPAPCIRRSCRSARARARNAAWRWCRWRARKRTIASCATSLGGSG